MSGWETDVLFRCPKPTISIIRTPFNKNLEKMSREIVIRKNAGEKLGIDLDTYQLEYNKPHVS